MALTPVFCTGFESGLVPSTNILLGWDSTAGSVISVGNSTTRNVRNGTYACRINRAANAAASLRRTAGITGNYARAVSRFAFNVVTLPSTGKAVIAFYVSGTTASWVIRVSSTGVVTLEDQPGTNVVTLGTVTTGTWHYVDFHGAVQTTTWDAVAALDGGTAQSTTTGGGSGGTIGGFAIGTYATTEAATVVDYDDILVGISATTTQADGFWGDGAVEGYRPASDGTHSFTTGDFSIGDAGATQAPTWTTAWQNVDDDPWASARSTTDAIGQRVIRTTGYVEVKPQQKSTHTGRHANLVLSHMLYSSSATQANTAATIIRSPSAATPPDFDNIMAMWGDLPQAQGGNGGALADYSESANFSKTVAFDTTAGGGVWDDAFVNGITWRFGGSNDISPVPTLQAVMLEVDWPAVQGTPFTVSQADAAGVTDALSIIQGYGVAPADSAGITDLVDRLWTAQITPPDSAGITDAVTPASGLVPAALADAAGITDTIAAGLAFSIAPPDAAGITDALTPSSGISATLSDAAGITDALSRVWAAVLSPPDSAGITDAVTAGLAYAASIADAAGITDALTTAQGVTSSLADAAGITDLLAPVVAYARTVADPAGITDVTGVGYGVGIADAGALTDALTSLATLARTIADAAAITDAATVQGTGAITQNLADGAGVTDSLGTTAGHALSVADQASLTDALAQAVTHALADGAALTDAATPSSATVLLLADAAVATDALNAVSGQLAAVSDAAAVTDALGPIVAGYVRSLSDVAGIEDTADESTVYAPLISDELVIEDAADLAAQTFLALSDAGALTDLAVPVVLVGGPRRWLRVVLTDEVLTELVVSAERVTSVLVTDEPLMTVALRAERVRALSVIVYDEPVMAVNVYAERNP